MTTHNRMRTAVFGAVLCCTGSLFAQTAGGDTTAKDKMFLKDAAEGGMTEIKASQLALKKSKNDDVKAYAQKMIDDHMKLMADMKPLMDKMSVKAPTMLKPEHKAAAQRMMAKSGASFDKEYVKDMVTDHHKTLAKFQTEVDTTSNADLKATVTSAIPVIKEHTDSADAMAAKMGMPAPAM